MDNIDYHQKAKLRWLFKTIMVAVATVLFGLSFNMMGGGQQSVLAADTYTPTSYMDKDGNWLGGTAAQHDTWLQKVVNLNWKGEEYAQEIGGDAKKLSKIS